MKKISKENKICIWLFIITMIVAVSPLISYLCINGHDLEYHLLRIESLKEGILIGKPFLKVNTLFFGGAGYASSMFYPDLLLYIPAILRAIGVGIGVSYHFYVFVIFMCCYGSTYYCTYKMTSSKYMASIAAILLTLCPYHMDDMLIRAACGEYMAFIFVPFVIYGVYDFVYDNGSNPWIFGLGFAGLILSHPATLAMCCVFTAVIFIISIKTFIKNPRLILKLIVTTILTLLATAFQWVPVLEQMMSTSFAVSSDTIDMLDAALNFADIFTEGFPAMGVVLPGLLIFRIFISREDSKILKYADLLMIAGLIFAIGAADIWPWDKLDRFLLFIQFPWRLFVVSSVLLSIADAIIIVIFTKEHLNGRIQVVICVILSISMALAMCHYKANATGYYSYSDDYYSYKPFTGNVIGGEWLPEAVTDREKLIELSEHMYADDGSDIEFTREKASVSAQIAGEYNYVDVPFIYYKGYVATITSDDGVKSTLIVTGEGEDGMSRVYLNGSTGLLSVKYQGTALITVSTIVSIITILGLIAFCLYKRKIRKAK